MAACEPLWAAKTPSAATLLAFHGSVGAGVDVGTKKSVVDDPPVGWRNPRRADPDPEPDPTPLGPLDTKMPKGRVLIGLSAMTRTGLEPATY